MQSNNKITTFSMAAIIAVSLIASTNFFENVLAIESQQTDKTTKVEEDKIIKKGTISSIPNPWPGHEGHQIATILPVTISGNNESSTLNTGYTGFVTFTASKPVQIIVPHEYTVDQSKIDADKFGSGLVTPIEKATFDLAVMQPEYNKDVPTYSYSMPFTGDGLVLHTFGDPFVVTYKVSASVDKADIINEIEDNTTN